MTTSPDQETATSGAVPTLRNRARALAPLGWTGREADWIALVALHTGVFTRAQLSHFLMTRPVLPRVDSSEPSSTSSLRPRTSGPSSPAARAPCC